MVPAFLYARNYAHERQRRAVQRQRPGPPGEQILLSRLHPRRAGPDSRHQVQQEPQQAFLLHGLRVLLQVLDTGLLRATVPTPASSTATSRRRSSPKWATSPLPAALPDRSRTRRMYPGGIIPASLIDKNMQSLMKLYPAAECRSQCHRRLQLRAGRDLQPEQHAVDVARGLQHQRQHQAVRPLQPAARNAAVPGGPLVAQRRPGSLSDAGAGQEPFRLRFRLVDPRLQPEHDERIRLRIHLHRLPERVRGSVEGGPHHGRLQLQRVVQERRGADPVVRRLGRRRSGAGVQPGRFRGGRPDGRSVCQQVHAQRQRHRHQGLRAPTRSKAGGFWERIRNAQPANNNTNGFTLSTSRQLQLSRATPMPICSPAR